MHKALIGSLVCVVWACGGGGSTGTGGSGGSGGMSAGGGTGTGGGSAAGGGGGGVQMVMMSETEPNDGPTLVGMQDLGTFDVSKTITLKGKLATGGNDGTKYTGDYDGFIVNVAGSGGSLGVQVDWTGTADVDLVAYDANLQPIYSDGSTLKPLVAPNAAAPAGKYAIVLFSKDLPADWTMTLSFVKTATGSGGTCNSTIAEVPGGGCVFTLIAPLNGQALTLPAEVGFNSCGCETPAKVWIYGNPPSPQNSYSISKTRGTNPLCSWTGRTEITQADLTQFGITSDNGVYHWQVESFYGTKSVARTFTLAPTVCK